MSSKIVAFSAVVALAASSALAQDLQINTPPQLIECQPTSLAWSGANSPFFLSVIPGGDPSGTPLEQFGQQDASPFKWTVDIKEGTSVTLSLTDSTGQTAFSDAVTILKGTDNKCIGKGAAAAGGSSSNSTSGAAAGASGASSASTHASGHASSASSAAGTRTTGAASADSAESSGAAPAGGNAAAASGSPTPDDDSAAGSLVARSTAAVFALVGAFAVLA